MKKIYHIFLLTVMLTAGFFPISAQGRSERRGGMHKEICEFRMKFIAQEMDLPAEKQKQFFDLYQQMSDEKRAVFDETIKLERKVRNDAAATDADYQALQNAMTTAKERDAAIEKKYDEKFAAFLSQKQIYLMKKAEMKFHEKMRAMRKGRKAGKVQKK